MVPHKMINPKISVDIPPFLNFRVRFKIRVRFRVRVRVKNRVGNCNGI